MTEDPSPTARVTAEDSDACPYPVRLRDSVHAAARASARSEPRPINNSYAADSIFFNSK